MSDKTYRLHISELIGFLVLSFLTATSLFLPLGIYLGRQSVTHAPMVNRIYNAYDFEFSGNYTIDSEYAGDVTPTVETYFGDSWFILVFYFDAPTYTAQQALIDANITFSMTKKRQHSNYEFLLQFVQQEFVGTDNMTLAGYIDDFIFGSHDVGSTFEWTFYHAKYAVVQFIICEEGYF